MAPPRLVYDDQCGFCTWSVQLAMRHGTFEPVGFSELTPDQRARLPEAYEECVHLLTDTDVYSCGRAAEQTIALMSSPAGQLFAALRHLPGYDRLREYIYRGFANRRDHLGRCRSAPPPASDRS